MSMTSYLFVGGPWDGQQHETDRKVVEVSTIGTLPLARPLLPGEQPEYPSSSSVMYRERFICGVPFMVPTTMSDKVATIKLSRAYHERQIYRTAADKLKEPAQ